MNWVIGKKQKRRNRIKAQFGKNPMELEAWESLEKRMREIRMYEELVVQDVKKEEWQSAGSVDTVTWNDLEMDRVFARINHTRTYMGEQILYHRLHNMQTRQSCENMEKRISFFFAPGIHTHRDRRKTHAYRQAERKLLSAVFPDGRN